MLINRDNYETIFLMYVDNELSPADRILVEEFVETNQDLLEELEVLQSTVLPNDDAVFVPKTQLYRNATPVESVQESLLLHLDNELADEYKRSLLQQIDENMQVKEEWNLLQKTVLDKNDKNVFASKELLYRRSERVIPMKFWRAAAAVIIGIGLFTGITLYNTTDNTPDVVVSNETRPAMKTINEPLDRKIIDPAVRGQDIALSEDAIPQTERKVRNVKAVASNKSGNTNIYNTGASIKNNEKDRASAEDEAVLAKQDNQIERSTLPSDKNEEAAVVTSSPVKVELTSNPINDLEVGKKQNTYARLAVNNEDPDRFLHMEEEKLTRTKLGGIIRQVRRVVERNTKIKTSNGLRIGGFEIAIK